MASARIDRAAAGDQAVLGQLSRYIERVALEYRDEFMVLVGDRGAHRAPDICVADLATRALPRHIHQAVWIEAWLPLSECRIRPSL